MLAAAGGQNVQTRHQRLGIDQPIVSQQLAKLRGSGIVVARKDGTTVPYALADPLLGDLLTLANVILNRQLVGSNVELSMARALTTAVLSALVSAAAFPAGSIVVTSRSRSMQPGELVVLTLSTSARADEMRVRAFDREAPAFRVDDLTWRALVGIDLDVRAGTYPVAIDGRAGTERLVATHRFVVQAKRFPTRVLKVDPAFVNPPAAEEARIVREAAELEAIWQHSASDRLWSAPFVAPVRSAANSAFGSRSIFNGAPRSPHAGADFPSAAGTPIASPNAGRVVLARDLYFSGNTVVLDHGLGLFSLLAHLSVIEVREGALVTAGQVIGKVGSTGRVTGPHLHWAVRLHGARIDPVAVLTLLGTSRS